MRMNGLDWSDLQIFMAVAQTGQMARAAHILSADATTIGRRLRRLERALGQTLFERTRQGQVLTEAGEALLARVEDMARAAAPLTDQAPGADGPTGTLRISVSEGFGSWFLAKYLPHFLDQYPGLTVDLVANSGFLSPSKREADIAVLLSRPKSGPLVARKLTDYHLRLYAAKEYSAHLPHAPADLANSHRLIGYIPDLIYAPELHYLDEIHPGLTAHLRSSSINAQHRLIAAGAGIGVLPCFMGDKDETLTRVLPQCVITRTLWLVTHRDTQGLSRVKAGKEWLIGITQSKGRELMPDNKALFSR
jgi:DNA-binding transcriptional LysR family regulator